MKNIDPHKLVNHWIHSHEEDEGDQLVYRTEDFDFPPARGRTGLDLSEGGNAIQEGPAPDDRHSERKGKWSLNDIGQLMIEDPSFGQTRAFEIVELKDDRLVLKKP